MISNSKLDYVWEVYEKYGFEKIGSAGENPLMLLKVR